MKPLTPLTITILKLDRSHFENSVDPDQLASQKPADQDPHCFQLASKYMPLS